MRIYKRYKGLFINLGWFSGEEFVLFKFAIVETIAGLTKIDCVVLLDLQIAKFVFCVGLGN